MEMNHPKIPALREAFFKLAGKEVSDVHVQNILKCAEYRSRRIASYCGNHKTVSKELAEIEKAAAKLIKALDSAHAETFRSISHMLMDGQITPEQPESINGKEPKFVALQFNEWRGIIQLPRQLTKAAQEAIEQLKQNPELIRTDRGQVRGRKRKTENDWLSFIIASAYFDVTGKPPTLSKVEEGKKHPLSSTDHGRIWYFGNIIRCWHQ